MNKPHLEHYPAALWARGMLGYFSSYQEAKRIDRQYMRTLARQHKGMYFSAQQLDCFQCKDYYTRGE